jgi:hypothetical protein
MKTLLTFVISAILISIAFAAQDAGKATGLADAFGDAIAKGTLDKAGDLLAENASIYWIQAKFANKERFGRFLRRELGNFDKHSLAFSQEDGVENETISTGWGSFSYEYGRADGLVSNRLLGRYTAVASKIDGKWQLVSLHLSVAYPAELSPSTK